MSLLRLSGVHAGYGGAEVLHDVGLEVSAGGVTAVLGANGAGKTTTLRVISASIRHRGLVAFDGRDLAGLPPDRIARLGIGHVPQGRGTLARLSTRDNLLAGALLRRERRAIRQDLDRTLDLFGVLRERLASAAGSLSGGEQQVLAVGRALMGRPRLLLLDEPSLGLAPRITRELFGALGVLRDEWGLSMLVVEQNAVLAMEIADHAVVLQAGRVVLDGPASEVAGHDEVRRAYLGI